MKMTTGSPQKQNSKLAISRTPFFAGRGAATYAIAVSGIKIKRNSGAEKSLLVLYLPGIDSRGKPPPGERPSAMGGPVGQPVRRRENLPDAAGDIVGIGKQL
jgi:hypothetical protein